MLKPEMPYFSDKEGERLPAGLPAVIDAHVHIFPNSIFSAIWKWFDKHAWHIRYKMSSFQIIEFLLSHGISHVIALQYAHKPGIAEQLNRHMSKVCCKFGHQVTGMATVLPGENNAEGVLQEAFDAGLGGLKLHAHVQCFDMNSEYMNLLYDCCQINKKPIVMHVGREPKSSAYNCDPYQICSVEKLERILIDFPKLKICVPHMGFDESEKYRTMIEKYDNLWLDTTMLISNYFPLNKRIPLNRYRSDRIMYGSDFPNIPYEWDRELKILATVSVSHETLKKITHQNAVNFFTNINRLGAYFLDELRESININYRLTVVSSFD